MVVSVAGVRVVAFGPKKPTRHKLVSITKTMMTRDASKIDDSINMTRIDAVKPYA